VSLKGFEIQASEQGYCDYNPWNVISTLRWVGYKTAKSFERKYHGVTLVPRQAIHKLREKKTEAGQNSIKLENREATLVPRLYETLSERKLVLTFKILRNTRWEGLAPRL